MLHVLNGKEMHACDQKVISEFGIPSLVLMEKASLGVCSYIKEHFTKDSSIGIVCGPGNNGGDGLAVGRLLFDEGYNVKIFLCEESNHLSVDAKAQYKSAVCYGIPFVMYLEEIRDCDVILDAIFGTGLGRSVEGAYREIITSLNEFPGEKIAVDIPSGICSDDGRVLGVAVKCSATVTFAYYKIGQLLFPGRAYCGEVVLCDIGISAKMLEDKMGNLSFEKEDLKEYLPQRTMDSHKGTYGKVLVVAGSKNMAGAAYFSAKAAYLMGAGLVQVFTEEANRIVLQSLLPEAILTTYDGKVNEDELTKAIQWADAIVVGPGLSTASTSVKILKQVLDLASVPVVIDADGLNILAEHKNLLKRPHLELVLTPHLGEMARLTGQPVSYVKENLLPLAEEFSRDYNVVVALKDAASVVAIPYLQSYINRSGNNGLSTGGSGDVLAGIMGGLMAQGLAGEVAAPLAVYFHGLCGEEGSKKKGKASLLAEDILGEIPFLLKEYVL